MITIRNTDNMCKCCTPEIDIDVDNQSTGANIDVDTEVVPVEIDKRGGDYNDLINKPKINGEILKGDKTGDELGLVDKTTEPNRVYGTDDEGNPTTIPYSEKADKEYIVRRNENGEIIVPETPIKNDSATSKKYVDDAIDAALEEATVFKGVVDNQTLLPSEGNRNGDMYWIREFVEPVPEGMVAGHSGTAIYNGTLNEFQFESDEIYDPDLKSIIFDSENKLAVQLSNQENNIIQFTENGLYASTSELEQALQDEIDRATTAEGQLNSDILAEASTRESNDEILDGKIDTVSSNLTQEIADRQSADETLQDNIDAEETRATTAEGNLNTKIEAETTRATGVEGTLSSLTTDTKTSLVNAINEVDSHADTNATNITNIQALIPNQATSENQLADKDFVNSSIATQTGNFIGTFPNIPARDAYTGEVTNNDYCFVINSVIKNNGNDWASFNDLNAYDKSLVTNFDYAWVIDGSKFDLYRFNIVNQVWEKRAEDVTKEEITLNSAYNRYKAVANNSTVTWVYEYTLNNSSFTASQWAAINSGATIGKINQITTNQSNIGTLSSLTTDAKTDLVSAINEVDSNINSETTRATTAEGNLNTKIEAETTRATGVEDSLGTDIINERNMRIAQDNALYGEIVAETDRATGVEGTLTSLTTTTKDNLVAAINEVNSDLSNYVPYTGATSAVNLNAQNLSNVSKLAVNNATVDSNEKLLVNGETKFVAGTNSVFIAKNINQTRKGMYEVPMGLEIQWHTDNLPYTYPLGFHDTSSNGQGGQFLFTSFSGNIGAASAGDVMVENDKGGLIFNTGASKTGAKMRFTVGNWQSTPQLTLTANSVGIKNLNPNTSYALDATGIINASQDVRINGVSVALPNQSGQSGKFLTTNGSTASWESISTDANVQYISGGGGGTEYIDLSDLYIDSQGSEYSFYYDSMSGTVRNANQFVDGSYAYGYIELYLENDGDITISFNQDSEQGCDFGEISNLDEYLNQDNYEDTDYVAWSGKESGFVSDSITFSNVTSGSHFFTIKYIKDSSEYYGSDTFEITGIEISSGSSTGSLVDTNTQQEIPLSEINDMPQVLQDIRDSIPDTSNFVTLNTKQMITAPKAITGTDVPWGTDQVQKNLFMAVSNNNTTGAVEWIGRSMFGANNLTFLMGTINRMAALGAHSWTSAKDGTGAAWADIYINPDGDKAVKIGGSPMVGRPSIMVIQNMGQSTTGTVKINRNPSLTSTARYKDVACWDDNVSKFNNDAGYITGIDNNDVINALGYTPQEELVSGTNIKTINNESILGEGNLDIDALPAQSGQNGKFLTTNGTSASWANIPEELPAQSGQSGKFLTTNGTAVSWASITDVEAFTSQEVQTIWDSVMTA